MSDLLVIDGLTVGYGEGVVLHDVNLELGAERAACLLGRNGVGKSTLLKTLIGLLRPRRGRIMFDGRDVTALRPNARARLGMGYVPQGRLIFPQLTVLENLQIGLEAGTRGGPMAVEEVYHLFPGIREMRKRQAGMLSGGQQQQLAIGRALVSRPRLLILDEPTEGIQPSVVLELRQALRRVREQLGVAIILAEQFIDFAQGLADDCYVLDGGTIALQGSVASIDRVVMNELLAV